MKVEKLDRPFPFKEQLDRSPGTHVSGVISSIMEDLFNQKSGEITTEVRQRMELGFIWETALEMAWKEMLGYRPDEIVVDGIAMSPDNIYEYEDLRTVVKEHKCTFTSSNKDPSDNDRYMMQVKSYCHAVGTPYAEMHILHLYGDYKTRPPVPIYNVSGFEFSTRELKENWDMMLHHAKAKRML